MATRRNVTSNLSDKTSTDEPLRGPPGPSDVSPAVPSSIIAKLIGFTAAMVVLPIGSYFLTVHNLFKGNSTYAGGLAALVANVVLIGYVIVAYYDDQSEQEEEKKMAMGKVE